MGMPVTEAKPGVRLQNSGQVGPASKRIALLGLFCASSTAGSVQLRNGGATGAVLVGPTPVNSGQWYTIPFNFENGLYVEVTAGTVDITVASEEY